MAPALQRFTTMRRLSDAHGPTLRRLERSELIARHVIPGSPPGVEYRGTDIGFALAPAIGASAERASTNFEEIERAQARHDASTGGQ